MNSTVFFEQQDFLRRIADGWDPTEAQTWFTNEQQARGLSSRSCTFTAAITDLIVQTAESLPPTFTLDYIRLRTLQADFQSLKSRAACLQTLKAMLKSLGWNGAIPQCSYDDFFARISVLISDEALKPDQSETIGDVTLEVVREAYKLCEISKLPTAEDLDFAENYLRDSWEGKNRVFAEVKSSLCEQLHNLVEEEVEAIGNLTPVQIINRYAPEGSELVTEQVELLRMAQKIAHIAVLHWRVWASIVYKQAVGHRFQEGSVSQVRSSFSSPNTTRPSSDSERNTRRGSAAVDM